MRKLLIAVPSIRERKDFYTSLFDFVTSLKGSFQVTLLIEKWQNMADVQNKIADIFLNGDFDYLLMLDDDITGHTKDMLEALVIIDAPVVAMQLYQRHYPYPNLLMLEGQGIDRECGYSDIDLTGFGMLLLRKEAFDRLQKPYFIAKNDGHNDWSTDQLFFMRLKLNGVKMVGCWDYCLNHDGITKENVRQLRENNAPTIIDRMIAYKKQGESK